MNDQINIALPKGRLGERVYAVLSEAGYGSADAEVNSRKLVFDGGGVRYFWVKPSDVPIYVERGAADLGVCGSDILLEHDPDVYELSDLHTGVCRIAVAAKKGFRDDPGRVLRVATKFENTARRYYAGICRQVDIIKLNGSIELAPILGLSDVIVDIVDRMKRNVVSNLALQLTAREFGHKRLVLKSARLDNRALVEKRD